MGAYWRHLVERLIIFAATVIISVTVVFFVPRMVPGNTLGALSAKLANVGVNFNSKALVDEYNSRFGLDKPLLEQYFAYVRQISQGDLGYSIASFPTTVGDLIKQALPWSLGLLIVTTIISWIFGSVIGGVVGWAGGRSRPLQALVPIALVLYTIPYYILAIILLFLLAFLWPIFPITGAYSAGSHIELTPQFAVDVLRHAALPALSIVLVSLGWWFLSMRSLIVTVKGEDYITWAEAKGLPAPRIFWAYAFRNALLPQVTGLALSLGQIVGGALVTETIFGYPGVGYLIFSSIKTLDYPVIQGAILLIVVSVASVNLIIDLLYPLIDPRIRFGTAGRS
ncbi:MAG: ABC transporter permease [Chloroflexi bacterium]|nr:ABC transporter permease [Chloroflexota bacterium]MBV9893344.1 ABC transporter permease [Chloroflexota bacterium]